MRILLRVASASAGTAVLMGGAAIGGRNEIAAGATSADS
jgi:hypothetical protein